MNVEGGAAHGHPIGATGAVLITRLLHSMQRDGLTRGLVTLCIGGGQGSPWRSSGQRAEPTSKCTVRNRSRRVR